MRLVTAYFKTCFLPELRIKAYSISKVLLISMGVGMAVSLSEDIVNNALTDLNPVSIVCSTSMDANSNASVQSSLHSSNRKRKHGNAQGLIQEHIDGNGKGAEVLKNRHSSISLSIAALEALETLLTMGGALKSAHWRSRVDDLILSLAVDSFEEGWAGDEKNTCSQNETTPTWADLQLITLRVLLASFLSSALVRPPCLSQGLELFRRGKQESGTKLAEFCAHALLVLEVLIHPRALPLNDFPNTKHNSYNDTTNKFPDIYDIGLKHSMLFGVEQVAHDAPESDDDELYRKLLRSDQESDLLSDFPPKKLMETGEPSSGPQIHGKSEKVREMAGEASMNLICPGNEINVTPHQHAATGDTVTEHWSEISIMPQDALTNEAVDKSSLGNEVMVHLKDGNVMVQESGIHENSTVRTDSSHNSQIVPTTISSDTHDSQPQQLDVQNVSAVKHENYKLHLNDTSSTDEDTFPDIVDEEPDSDY